MKIRNNHRATTLAQHVASIYRPAAKGAACALFAAAALSACGGGGGGSGGGADTTATPTQPSASGEAVSTAGTFAAGAQNLMYRVFAGSAAAEVIGGGDARAFLFGLAGNDTLVAGASGGALYGDAGDDLLLGRAAGDRLMGGMGNDRIYGGAGNDMLMGGEGDDTLDEGAGHGDLDGGPGNDTLIGGPGADAFAIGPDSGNDVIRDFTPGPGMFDHLAIRGLRWSDLTFRDMAAGVMITWTGGSVLLEGVRMADLAQDDFMFMDTPDLPPGARAPNGPAGERPSPSTDGPAVNAQVPTGSSTLNFTAVGDQRYQVTVGTSAGETLQGTDGWDHLIGLDGNDTLIGGAGDDVLEGNAGDDRLEGGAGQDRLDGGPGNDTLIGGEDNDELMGGDGDDVIDAGAGHDMIEGGKGNDTITGGPGADAFIVRPDSGHDVVLDFEATGAAQGAFDHIAFMDIVAEQVTVTDTPNGALVSWDMNGDGVAEGSVLLRGVPKSDLRQSDFMFNARPGFVAGVSALGSYYVFPSQ